MLHRTVDLCIISFISMLFLYCNSIVHNHQFYTNNVTLLHKLTLTHNIHLKHIYTSYLTYTFLNFLTQIILYTYLYLFSAYSNFMNVPIYIHHDGIFYSYLVMTYTRIRLNYDTNSRPTNKLYCLVIFKHIYCTYIRNIYIMHLAFIADPFVISPTSNLVFNPGF